MRKNVFLKAAVITILIFMSGLFVGVWLDNSRIGDLREKITKMDLDWNDARLQAFYYQTLPTESLFCESAIKSNREFSDKIYLQGVELEKIEKVNRFTPEVILQKQRYALLQLQFWLNSVHIKNTCNANYSTLIYFYSHMTRDQDVKRDQNLQSAVVVEAIHRCGDKLMSVPIPLDVNISTVDAIASMHNITVVDAPTLLINEDIVLRGVQNTETLKDALGC